MFESLRILIARNRPGLEIFKQSTVDTYLLATESTPVYNIINFQDSILCKNILLSKSTVTFYRREPKNVTTFNLFTFFHADINQSEVEDSFQLDSDWIKST